MRIRLSAAAARKSSGPWVIEVRSLLFGFLAVLVVVLDQASKLWLVRNFSLFESWSVIPGCFNLTYLTNTGVAFGLLAGPVWWRQVFFIVVTVAALVVIGVLHWRLREKSVFYTVSLGLIAGGAVGNLVDRVRLGSVVDFLDFYLGSHHWPAFNVADSAITVGVGLFLVYSLFFEKDQQKTD